MHTGRLHRTTWSTIAMGAATLAALGVHACVEKTSATRFEMLYLCHISSALIGLGLLVGSVRAVAAGVLALGALGVLPWLVYMALTGDVTATSIAAHVVPLVSGAYFVTVRGMPEHTATRALCIHAAALVAGVFAAPPEANLNLAFGPGPGMLWLRMDVVPWRCLLCLVATVLLLAADRLVRKCVS